MAAKLEIATHLANEDYNIDDIRFVSIIDNGTFVVLLNYCLIKICFGQFHGESAPLFHTAFIGMSIISLFFAQTGK